MTDEIEAPTLQPHDRVFLVVVDRSEEMRTALRYACRRALRTRGRVALLHVVEPGELQAFPGVGRVMEEEARVEAEQRVHALAAEVFEQTGAMPTVHIRHGKGADELAALLAEEPSISLLVLATAVKASNPGPLITWLMGQLGRKVRIPVTLVPGDLDAAQLDALS